MVTTETSNVEVFAIGNEAMEIFTWVVFTVTCQLFNLFGIVTNIINIICFIKQGVKDSVNISLLGLSVADLGCLTTMAWTSIFLTPAFMTADLPFDPMDFAYLTSGMIHFCFVRVSSCITAIITLERCLCIMLPFKVKCLLTPNRSIGVTVSVFIILFLCNSPVWVVNRLDNKFSQMRNKTLYGVISTDDREHVEKISFTINNFAIHLTIYFIIVICTIILSLKLLAAAKWRKSTSSSKQVDRVCSRNINVAKMVVMIAILFTVSFVPTSAILLAIAIFPALSLEGKYLNIALVISGIGVLLESINSSMNIFIYYHMSSKYRSVFNIIFCRRISPASKVSVTTD